MAIGTFGSIVFEASFDLVRTFTGFSRSGESRWAVHEVAGGAPVPEFVGPELETIALSIRLDASFGVTPSTELETIRTMRKNGEVNPLIIGAKPLGNFAIVSSKESWTYVDNKGALIAAIVDVEFREYN